MSQQCQSDTIIFVSLPGDEGYSEALRWFDAVSRCVRGIKQDHGVPISRIYDTPEIPGIANVKYFCEWQEIQIYSHMF